MLLTEDEAKKKWCPYTPPAISGTRCMASGCMAWRSVDDAYEITTTDLGQMPKGDGWRQIARSDDDYGLRWQRLQQKGGGFCGAFGRPA